MSFQILAAGNILNIVADITSRHCVFGLSNFGQKQFAFARGDIYKGLAYIVSQTGLTDPAAYSWPNTTLQIALTDGARTVYCSSTNVALGTTPNQPVHFTFNLSVSGTPLDAALNLTSDPSIPAWLEVQFSGVAAAEGSALAQAMYLIRDPVVIYKTALNPLP